MLLGIEALGGLTLGDAPFAPFVPPPFSRTAADLIVVDSTMSGSLGSTDVTRQAFQSSDVAINDPQQLLNDGAVFVFAAGFNMREALNPVCTLTFTPPTGPQFAVQTPFVYVGQRDIPTYEGRFLGGFYVIYIFPPNVLVRGQWSAQLSFQTTPQMLPMLSDAGFFNV